MAMSTPYDMELMALWDDVASIDVQLAVCQSHPTSARAIACRAKVTLELAEVMRNIAGNSVKFQRFLFEAKLREDEADALYTDDALFTDAADDDDDHAVDEAFLVAPPAMTYAAPPAMTYAAMTLECTACGHTMAMCQWDWRFCTQCAHAKPYHDVSVPRLLTPLEQNSLVADDDAYGAPADPEVFDIASNNGDADDDRDHDEDFFPSHLPNYSHASGEITGGLGNELFPCLSEATKVDKHAIKTFVKQMRCRKGKGIGAGPVGTVLMKAENVKTLAETKLVCDDTKGQLVPAEVSTCFRWGPLGFYDDTKEQRDQSRAKDCPSIGAPLPLDNAKKVKPPTGSKLICDDTKDQVDEDKIFIYDKQVACHSCAAPAG